MFLIKKMGWLILELVLFTVIFIALIAIQYYLMKALGISNGIWNAENITESSSPFLLVPSFLPVLIAFSGASVLTYHTIMKHPFQDLGFVKDDALKPVSYTHLPFSGSIFFELHVFPKHRVSIIF